MPRIDALLTAMVTNHAESVRLADGDVAYLMLRGAQHPLTRQPLGAGQLVALLSEMAPPHVSQDLAAGKPLEFLYTNADGRFLTRLENDGQKVWATVSPASANGTNGNGHAAAAEPQSPRHATNGNGVAREAPQPVRAEPARAVVESDVSDEPARSEIDGLLRKLVEGSASDLHLRVGEPPILRIHGELKRMLEAETLSNARVEAMLNGIMPERNRSEYREVNDTDFAYEIPGLARFRANAFRDHKGAGGVFRVIPAKVATVEDLGITPEVQNLCFLTKGLVLVTGPTGSGKSTTLGGLIDLINRSRDDHVVTIEDPIEFVHINKRCVITQRQVGLHTVGFKSALRAALREDPDIVLVGEMRDLETVSIALETAETGHLVFGTLHTTTAVGTIDRIIDQFPADRQAQIRVMLADTLKGVISQTLCKKIGGGRVAVREILLTVPAVSNLIREGKAYQLQSVMQTSRKLGMILLGDVLIDLVDNGVVEPKEAYMKATDKAAFMAALKTRGHDVSFMMV
ncbi:MAG: type IV pilus twitching motility protein PilT [Gemmatimonadaceae bacterium]